MNEIKELVFKLIKTTIIVVVVIIVAIYLLIDNPKPIIMGVIFGSALGILNFYDLSLTLIKASTMNPGKAKNFTASKYMIRYGFMGIILFISIKADYIHILGTILGLLLIKFVIIATNLFNDKKYFINIIKRKEDK